jgi:2'-hydroxyisoflavone reductase
MERRQFVTAMLGGLGMSSFPALFAASAKLADRELKILILGGTGFLGPHTVRYALHRGHEVTLFNRGKTNSGLFPELETIIGDRDPEVGEGLSGLKGRQWDAVIDNSGYVPRITGASSRLLADSVNQYLFVSTICQYDKWADSGDFFTEERPGAILEDPATEDVSTHYCALKAYCERAVDAAMPGRTTQVRPGLIVGPLDRSDRFTYWPVRVDRGGEVLAPGKPSDLTQYIDVRDLAEFMVHCIEQNLTDTFNAIRMPMPMGDFLESCVRTVNPEASLTWVDADFLEKHDVQSLRDMPMWASPGGAYSGSMTWSGQKALDAGMKIRPVEETIRDTLEWFKSLPQERQSGLRTRMTPEREAEVLAAWHARGNQGDVAGP